MDNLISLFTKLSDQFLKSDEPSINKPLTQKETRKNLKLVRQKAFDVIHQYRQDAPQPSKQWYPEILITDYAYELLEKGAEGSSATLFESIGVLEQSGYDYEEILNFLLCLKGPFSESSSARQHAFSLSGCDYFLRPSTNPYELLPEELTSGVVDNTTRPEPTAENLFLDNFINIPKKTAIGRSLPCLQDLVENEFPTPKKRPPTREEPKKPRAISPWSDFEQDILDEEFIETETETDPKKPFLENYEQTLHKPGRDPFQISNKKKTGGQKREGLSLSMFLEEQHLKSLIEPSTEYAAYHKTDLQDFVEQVKYLMLGVDSRVFKYDAVEKKFFMKCGVYVDGLPPDCLFEVSQPFLECGTFFKNLSIAVAQGVSSNSGVIYSVFWNSVAKFLHDYSEGLANLPSQDILTLLKIPRSKIFLDLAAVYRLCFPKTGDLPTDGHLISYLFEYPALMQCRSVLFAVIYDCCAVYFAKLLEKWMFQGLLDDCSRDFFIRENNEGTSGRDRSLYKSVTICEESVPSFLRNLALKICSCGKAIWLLRMCDPENKFIVYTETKKLPKLRLCFTDTDFSNMEIEFKNYEKAIHEICGEDITFKSLRETEEHDNLQLLQSPKITEKPSELPQMSVNKQIEENEKKLTTEFYEQLSRDTDRIKNVAEWRSKRLDLYDRRVEFLKDDLINENTVLDEEGNVIVPTEADVENANIVLEQNLCNSPRKTDNEALINKNKILGTTLFDDYSPKAKPISAEALRNRMKIMGTETSVEPIPEPGVLTEAMKNKMKIMGTDNSEPVVKNVNNMTEAMKNRLKILNAEYENVKNEEPTVVQPLTEAMKNKLKVLGTEYENVKNEEPTVVQPLTEAMKNKLKVLGTEYENVKNEEPTVVQPLTEAMKNKLKVLGTEFDCLPEARVFVNKELSDAMKNKNRVMGTEISDVSASTVGYEHQPVKELTQAQKNKLKILGTDFDLPVPQHVPHKPVTKKTSEIVEQSHEDTEITHKSTVNIFKTKPLQLSLLDATDTRPKPNFEDMDITTFARSIQRSLLVALNVQERLANSSVLKHFLVKENFKAHLTSLRSFYLLQDGEFSRSLTYGLFQSLLQSSEPQQFFDSASLSGILNEALNCAHQGSLAKNVSFQILKIPKKLDKQSHDILTPFQLSYKVSWPVNIVITGQILNRYRQVFHVLVNLKRVHWMLNETFLLLKSQTKDQILDGKLLMKSPEYTKLSTYRHAMTLFIMTLEEHLSTNALQEAWSSFLRQLETVNDLDHLYQKHVEFVKDVQRRCFLSRSSSLLSYINELIELGLNFHHILNSSPWLLINEKQYSHPKFTDLKVIFNKFCKVTKVFTKTLRKKSQNEDLTIHTPLLELIDLKIKF